MKKSVFFGLCALGTALVGGLGYGVHYLFDYAIVQGEKDFINGRDEEKINQQWDFSDGRLSELTMESEDGLELYARYVEQEKPSKKIAIVAHGYAGDSMEMGEYAEIFDQQGFNVLVPDNRSHGKSEGKYIGFGWLDRLDYVKWINLMVGLHGQDAEIILFGVSMGAATVMMTSGEALPPQVKLIIEDCGYDSVTNELQYQLKDMFNLPAFPLIPLTSMYTDIRAGYDFKEASSVAQLEKNKLPALFIHGSEDNFVPTEMVYPLYEATQGPKELVVFEGAKHAQSLKKHPKVYRKTVIDFINQYL